MTDSFPTPFKNFSNITPPDDNRDRLVCGDCGWIHCENPRIIVGAVARKVHGTGNGPHGTGNGPHQSKIDCEKCPATITSNTAAASRL